MATFKGVLLVCAVTFLCLVYDVECLCKMSKGEEGSKFCDEAFKHTYENNKLKVLAHPKKTGCCVTHELGDCVEYAYSKAKCSTIEQKIRMVIEGKIQDAQTGIHTAAKYLGTHFCGDTDRSKCGHLVDDYDKAKREIDILNGVTGLLPTYFILAITMAGFYLQRGFW